jgi:hypothetical protein
VIKFQQDQTLPQTGKLDKDTLDRLNTIYDTRKPYIDAAKHDPAKPGTRTLSAVDKTAAVDAMVPKPGAGGAPAVFTRVTPDGKDYGDEIRDALTGLIKTFHKDLYEDKVGLRADPAKNMHDWSVMEGPPKASKQVTDALYASNYGGAAAFPAMTHAGGNLIDQWTDEESRNALLTDPQKKAKAREKVVYLINSNCDAVNAKRGAVPSSPAEKAILDPIVDSFVSDKPKIQTMLDLDIGWEGAQLEGVVYLQRYKSQNADTNKAKEENRVQMWDLFQTCIHEYIHTLAHPTYQTWAQSFATARGISERLGLVRERYSVSFQSRLGRIPWIQPFTDVVLPELAQKGVKKVAVFCPAFVADCLETLEEIGLRAKELFREHGGEDLALVPSLNATPKWVDAAAELVRR